MAKVKTHIQFLADFYNKNDNANNIEILEKYQGTKTKILCQCTICKHMWRATPSNLIQNKGCPVCFYKNKRKTHQEFIEEMEHINPNIEIHTEYYNRNTRIYCTCKICGNKWDAKAGNLLNGRGCKKCSNKHLSIIKRKSHEEFVRDLSKRNIHFNTFEILDKYVGDDDKIRCRCKKCNYIWEVTPRSLYQGHNCPNCVKSRGEECVEQYLKKHNINYESQKRFKNLRGIGNKLLSYDYYIPCCNILIEYQGKQHYQALDFFGGDDQFIIQKEHDKRKKEYAQNNGYDFIEIPYWEYDNIDRILSQKIKV